MIRVWLWVGEFFSYIYAVVSRGRNIRGEYPWRACRTCRQLGAQVLSLRRGADKLNATNWGVHGGRGGGDSATASWRINHLEERWHITLIGSLPYQIHICWSSHQADAAAGSSCGKFSRPVSPCLPLNIKALLTPFLTPNLILTLKWHYYHIIYL